MSGCHISFTDGTGAAQLDNGLTGVAAGVGAQFRSWLSESKPVGPSAWALGTGAMAAFVFRTDYLASFELQEIPNANVAILDRLIAWLESGGTVSVTCGDTTSAVYATCGLAEGAKPVKKLFDKTNLTWSLTVTLVNLAGSPGPMTCIYAS